MPPSDPRGRLLSGDGHAMSEVELLAVCLGTGVAGRSVQELAASLLERYGSLSALLDASVVELLREAGLGRAKVAHLKALLALAARYHRERLVSGPVLVSSSAVRGYLRCRLAGARRELFAALFLDSRHYLIRFEVLFSGTVDRAAVHPREVLRRALELNAAAVILAHNHPSGIAEPSSSDVALTASLERLLEEIDVRLLDHVVVGRGAEVSLAERGLLSAR